MGGWNIMNSTYDVLFSKARSGDIGAFDKLTRAYHKRVFNIVLKICNDRAIASTLAQEVFVKAYKEITTGKCEMSITLLVYRMAAEVCSRIQTKHSEFISRGINNNIVVK